MPIRRWPLPRPLHVRLASTHRRGQNLSERYRKLENITRATTEHDVSLQQSNGPAAARIKTSDTIGGFMIPQPPLAPADDECCMSGCAVCVYDLFEDALATYKEEVAALRGALAGQDIPETEWPVHIRAGTYEGKGDDATASNPVLNAFEEMERALQAKREKRAAAEAESSS